MSEYLIHFKRPSNENQAETQKMEKNAASDSSERGSVIDAGMTAGFSSLEKDSPDGNAFLSGSPAEDMHVGVLYISQDPTQRRKRGRWYLVRKKYKNKFVAFSKNIIGRDNIIAGLVSRLGKFMRKLGLKRR